MNYLPMNGEQPPTNHQWDLTITPPTWEPTRCQLGLLKNCLDSDGQQFH